MVKTTDVSEKLANSLFKVAMKRKQRLSFAYCAAWRKAAQWRWVVSFTLLPLYNRRKSHR